MDIDLTPLEALQLACDIAGSQAKLGAICEVSQTAVWKWLNEAKQISADNGRVIRAEAATGVSRHYLRPDVYPLELPQAPARWFGVDQCAGIRPNGLDTRANRVSFNTLPEMKGASA